MRCRARRPKVAVGTNGEVTLRDHVCGGDESKCLSVVARDESTLHRGPVRAVGPSDALAGTLLPEVGRDRGDRADRDTVRGRRTGRAERQPEGQKARACTREEPPLHTALSTDPPVLFG